MLFPTVEFAVFFVVVLTVSWLLMRARTPWKLFVLAASYVFYAGWDWRYCFLLAGSTLVNQFIAVQLSLTSAERVRRWWIASAVAANLGVLGWFKYYGFFVVSATNALGRLGIEPPLPLLSVVLPVGISFFTFQAMSYVMDVYRRDIEVASWLDAGVYLSFFPQLVAGPIVRGSEFLPQLAAPRDPRSIPAAKAFGLILGGLFKKVVIANVLATTIVDQVFASPAQHSSLEVLFGIYGYAVQIYADFSGYTDIAIGVALLMGFQFPQNFDAPYSAISIRDFWRRWHMTLSRWLRDYLYIPLGGSAGSEAATYGALIATMVLGGLWHGAAWTFVIWGAFHGVVMAVERATGQGLVDAAALSPGSRFIRRFVTFNLVCLGWVFFRAESTGRAFEILARLVDVGSAPAVTPAVMLLVLIGIGVQYLPKRWGTDLEVAASNLSPIAVGAALGVGLLAVDALGPQGVAPFIYFQF